MVDPCPSLVGLAVVESARADGVSVDNLDLNLIYNTSESHKSIATVMSQMWKQKLGAQVELANMEWKIFLEERGNQNL